MEATAQLTFYPKWADERTMEEKVKGCEVMARHFREGRFLSRDGQQLRVLAADVVKNDHGHEPQIDIRLELTVSVTLG